MNHNDEQLDKYYFSSYPPFKKIYEKEKKEILRHKKITSKYLNAIFYYSLNLLRLREKLFL